MKTVKLKSILFGLTAVLTIAIIMTACEQQSINDITETINAETNIQEMQQRNPFGYKVSEKQFRFHPKENNFSGITRMYWRDTLPRFFPEIAASFHGDINPNACAKTAACILPECFHKNPIWDADNFTGLQNSTSFTPKCPNTPIMGNSLMAYSQNANTATSGIGIYTFTGPRPFAPGNAFFQPLQTNPTTTGIQGLYIGFPAYLSGNSMKPFSSECTGNDCGDKIRLRVWAKQGVKTARNNSTSQTQQKMAFMLHNIVDTHPLRGRIEFTPYTFCGGNCPTDNNANFSTDPNQGGVPFIGGRLAGGGNPTLMTTNYRTTVAWESYGPSTQDSPFDLTWFHYEISWDNFVTTLRQFTDVAGLDGNNNADVATLFGNGWSVKNSWELKHVRFGQEVYNPDWDNEETAFVGGHTNWIQFDAITK